jgi:hypothetical protein
LKPLTHKSHDGTSVHVDPQMADKALELLRRKGRTTDERLRHSDSSRCSGDGELTARRRSGNSSGRSSRR